jgi:hypothetical protein
MSDDDFRTEIMECLTPQFVALAKRYGLSVETILDWLEVKLARRRTAKMELEEIEQELAADRFLKKLVEPQPKPVQANGAKFVRRA